MAFGGKLNKTSTIEIDGMTIEVNRLDNNVRRLLDIANRENDEIKDRILARQKVICENLIKSWSGLTESKLAKYFVSNRTHFGSKTFEVDGDSIDIARSSMSEVMQLVDSESKLDYKVKAKLAMDTLLLSKDAKVFHGGKVKKMNASIREEIKSDESWQDIPNFIIELSMTADEFLKPMGEDEDKEVSFKPDLISDAYCHPMRDNLILKIHEQASNNDMFRQKAIDEEVEDAKN